MDLFASCNRKFFSVALVLVIPALLLTAFLIHPYYAVLFNLFYAVSVFLLNNEFKKKQDKGEKIFGMPAGTLHSIISWEGVFAAFLISAGVYTGEVGFKHCPDSWTGTASAEVKVVYFYNPFCYKCVFSKADFESAFSKHRSEIVVFGMDTRYCEDEMEKFGVHGAPTLVLLKGNCSKFLFGSQAAAAFGSALKEIQNCSH